MIFDILKLFFSTMKEENFDETRLCHANVYWGIIYKQMPFSSTTLELIVN